MVLRNRTFDNVLLRFVSVENRFKLSRPAMHGRQKENRRNHLQKWLSQHVLAASHCPQRQVAPGGQQLRSRSDQLQGKGRNPLNPSQLNRAARYPSTVRVAEGCLGSECSWTYTWKPSGSKLRRLQLRESPGSMRRQRVAFSPLRFMLIF